MDDDAVESRRGRVEKTHPVSAEEENCAVADMMAARVQCRATTRATTIAPTRDAGPTVGATYSGLTAITCTMYGVFIDGSRLVSHRGTLGSHRGTLGTIDRGVGRGRYHIYTRTHETYTHTYRPYMKDTPPPPGDARDRVVRSVAKSKSTRVVARHTDAPR